MRYYKHIDKLKRFMAFLHLFGVAPLPDPRRGPSEVAGVWCQEGWVSSTAIGSRKPLEIRKHNLTKYMLCLDICNCLAGPANLYFKE